MRKSRLARALWLLTLVLVVSASFVAAVTMTGSKPFPGQTCIVDDDCTHPGYVCCGGRCTPVELCPNR
jgi:hypothetical protein